jgi:nucleotide-binding universal stress UspA family protein
MPQSRRFLRVLVAIDGSKESMRAANFGLSIAVKNGADLTLLYVLYSQLAYAYTSYLSKVESSSSISSILDSTKTEANQWFDVIKSKLANIDAYKRKIKGDVIITSTSIPGAIIDYADHNMIDLIVIGTKARSALKKAMFGSVTSEVLAYSHCSVLIIK